jgi:hypothetical protein
MIWKLTGNLLPSFFISLLSTACVTLSRIVPVQMMSYKLHVKQSQPARIFQISDQGIVYPEQTCLPEKQDHGSDPSFCFSRQPSCLKHDFSSVWSNMNTKDMLHFFIFEWTRSLKIIQAWIRLLKSLFLNTKRTNLQLRKREETKKNKPISL